MSEGIPFALVYSSLESTWSREVIERAIHAVSERTRKALRLPDMIEAVKTECAAIEGAAKRTRESAQSALVPKSSCPAPTANRDARERGRTLRKFAALRARYEGGTPAWAKKHPDYAEGYQRQSCAQWGYDRRANQ